MQKFSYLKKPLIGFTVLLVLGLGIHFYLYYRATFLLKAFVEDISSHRYTATAKHLRFGYFPLKLKGVDVHLFPLDTAGMQRQYHIGVDSFQLKLRALAPLLFYSVLDVEDVRIVRPVVEVLTNGSLVSKDSSRFNIPLQEIQDALLEGLAQFQVNKCDIINGSFKITRTDNQKKFGVNHIDLTIDSLMAARKGILLNGNDTLVGHLILKVKNPEILIPDPDYHVEVDQLFVNTRQNIFNIDELRFSRIKEDEKYDTIKLSTLELRGLDWDYFLNKGVVSLDSVRIKNGLAQIDLSNKMLFRKNVKNKKDNNPEVPVPLLLRHVMVQEVSYKLRTKGKQGNFTMTLKGDSLKVDDFKWIEGRKRPVSIGELSLNVRNYVDKDDKRTYQSGFDRLLIRNENLEIKNYSLIPLNREGFGVNNQLFIPSILLDHYDFSQLIQGVLQADQLTLENPKLVIDILKSGKKDSLSRKRGFFEFLNALQPNLNIKTLNIKDAQVSLQPLDDLGNTIEISQLSTTIDLENLLAAQNIGELITVSKGVYSDGFFIKGQTFQFDVGQAEISSGVDRLNMKRLQGTLSGGLDIDLEDVLLISKPEDIIIPLDGTLNLSELSIGSGIVFLRTIKKDAAFRSTLKTQELNVDNLKTGNMQLSIEDNSGMVSSIQNVQFDIKNLQVSGKDVQWKTVLLNGNAFSTGLGNVNIQLEALAASLPGRVSLAGLKLWKKGPIRNNEDDILFPAINFNTNIHSLKWNADAISNLLIITPSFKFVADSNGQNQNKIDLTKLPPINIDQFRLVDPDLSVSLFIPEKGFAPLVMDKGSISGSGLSINTIIPGRIKMDDLQIFATNPTINIPSYHFFKPTTVWMAMSKMIWDNEHGLIGSIDTAKVQGLGEIPLPGNQDNQQFNLDEFGLAGWRLPLSSDSVVPKLVNGSDWWVRKAYYSYGTPTHTLAIYVDSVTGLNSQVKIDSMYFLPKIPRDAFWKSKAVESDYFTLKAGKTVLSNISPQMNKKGPYKIGHISISDWDLSAERDKTMPVDTTAYRPLLVKQLENIPVDIMIDSVDFNNGSITYREIGKKFKQEGFMNFSDINGAAHHIYSRNRPSDSATLILSASGKFMGEANLSLLYLQKYNDSLQTFSLDAGMGKFNMTGINPLVAPLASVAISRGWADSLYIHVTGDNYKAYGVTFYDYNKFKIQILRNGFEYKYPFSGIKNFGVNLILPNKGSGKQQSLIAVRDTSKGTFNFWGKILSQSLQNNLGVPGKRKKTKKAISKMRKEEQKNLRP